MKELLKTKVDYTKLTGKEQEVINFHKTAAVLADFGFECSKISADKNGADMNAYHIETGKTISIQLKGSRATLCKKYMGRGLWIAYIDQNTNEVCFYDHDQAVSIFEQGPSAQTVSWKTNGQYSGKTMHRQFEEAISRLSLCS
jgi:hypothetical protein